MIKGKKVLGIIPARGGSVRVPKKNLMKIGNKTLLEHAIMHAKNSKYIDNIICSTDSNEIKDLAIKNGCSAPFLRPKFLSTSKATTQKLLEYMCKKIDYHHYIILIQPTSPLRTSKDIDDALLLCEKNDAYSVVSVTETRHITNLMYTFDKNKKFKPTKINQLNKKVYVLNGAVYILRFNNLLNKLPLINSNTIPFKMPFERSIDIDTKLDLEVAKIIYKKKLNGNRFYTN